MWRLKPADWAITVEKSLLLRRFPTYCKLGTILFPQEYSDSALNSKHYQRLARAYRIISHNEYYIIVIVMNNLLQYASIYVFISHYLLVVATSRTREREAGMGMGACQANVGKAASASGA